MPTYVARITSSDYTIKSVLANTTEYVDFRGISYRLALNDIDSCHIDLNPSCTKSFSGIDRWWNLLLYRDGALQFSGPILREAWELHTDPTNDIYEIDALGGMVYLDWHVIDPAGGSAYDERTDHADDLAKAYVYYHVSAAATVADKRYSDLTVAADAHACTSWTEQPRYENVLKEVQKLAALGGFDFRCVPSGTGYVFTTAYPQWGLDRTWGNGVNTDAVFSGDRRNFAKITWERDALAKRNYVYMAGQGEGADQVIRTRGDAWFANDRREVFESATAYEDSTAIDYIADQRLAVLQETDKLDMLPLSSTWKLPWDLGDLVTVQAVVRGRTFTQDCKVVAVSVEVAEDGTETVTPELVAV